MDTLSDIIEVLDMQVAHPCRIEVDGDWSLRFTECRHIRVGAVLAGEMYLRTAGNEPAHLRRGDCYLLSSGLPYIVGSDPNLEPEDGTAVFEAAWPDTVYYNVSPGRPGRTSAMSGAVAFDENTAALLLDHLPEISIIRVGRPEAGALRPILELLAQETTAGIPGTGALRGYLTQALVVQALRAVLAQPGEGPTGWLRGLGDERLRRSLVLLHQQSARQWTVAELASEVQMSRSAFALRFRTVVGLAPLEYLLSWRVQMAGRRLRSTDRTVAAVAAEFGFGSERAFVRSFKRVTGLSPARYRSERPIKGIRTAPPRREMADDEGAEAILV
ncbi:AraC family transcriptional regulator [Micromonospora sp. NPDC049230]|uniref:AraC family transcriptional regulator n=1 Tax=Micromonospora sp. NPDC049230 TaxID=3155502 RepID=UPI00340A8452